MRLTASQLRRIIQEEVTRVTEGFDEPGTVTDPNVKAALKTALKFYIDLGEDPYQVVHRAIEEIQMEPR